MKYHYDDVKSDKVLFDESGTLKQIHSIIQNENNIFANPQSDTQHILLLYYNENDLRTFISEYLNEGLKCGELCIHTTTDLLSEDYISNFISNIEDYQKKKNEGSLLMLNLEPHYKKATTGNLKPFDDIAKRFLVRAKKDSTNRLDRRVRITTDCANLLFKNGYFEQCSDLERWWHQKPFAGTYLCTYPKSLFDKFPNNIYFSTLFHCHDVVVNTKGRRYSEDLLLEKHD